MEDKSLLVEGTWWKNKKTGDMGFITDVQKKKGLIIFRFFQSGHVGSFTNMEFLREFEILPSHSKIVPESNVNNECDKLQTHVITPGSIYFNCVGGMHIAIPFKEESGVVSFITSDVLNDEVYFRTDVIEFIERYTLYQVFNKPDNGEAFDELVNKTKERYDKMIRKDELIMGNSKETYLNTDESKMKEFGTGAKREDKTGKGRYDLIPGDVMSELEDFAWETYFNNGSTTCSATDVSKSAYFDDWTDVELYYDFIVNVISYFFAKDHIECTDDCGEVSYEVNWDIFRSGLYEMRKQLALHYEAGAVVHGVDNWKKGLPVYGSERGGCFLDSMRRHIDQALMGLTDEPHAVAALWNAFSAIWTLKNKPANTTNSSETKPEKDTKASKRSDMKDSLIHAASRYAEVKSKDCEADYLTLPSGRKIKIEFQSRTDDEKDKVFLMALLRNKHIVDDIMKSLESANDAGDDQN